MFYCQHIFPIYLVTSRLLKETELFVVPFITQGENCWTDFDQVLCR